jgi:hypothetical protein
LCDIIVLETANKIFFDVELVVYDACWQELVDRESELGGEIEEAECGRHNGGVVTHRGLKRGRILSAVEVETVRVSV